MKNGTVYIYYTIFTIILIVKMVQYFPYILWFLLIINIKGVLSKFSPSVLNEIIT